MLLYMKDEIKKLFNQVDELQKIIDSEQDSADAGSVGSRSRIINAEIEKESIQEKVDALAAAALWMAFAS